MKKIAILLVVVMALSLACLAAETKSDAPKVEVYGGYALLRADTNGTMSQQNMSGWDGAMTVSFNRYFGITADVSGAYKTFSASTAGSFSGKLNEYSFLFGPTISFRGKGRVKPFLHGLFGVSRASATATGIATATDNSFAMATGGGVDVKMSKHISIRLGQVDWLRTTFSSTPQNNIRFSAGLVAGF